MKRLFVFLTVFLLLYPSTGCDKSTGAIESTTSLTSTMTQTAVSGSSPDDCEQENRELASYLPEKPGYTWKYEGTAGYGHMMETDEISYSDQSIRYIISGTVDDLSDGASGRALDVLYTYEISNGELLQYSNAFSSMDSVYKKITLLKSPVYDGMTWTQEAVTKEDTVVTLECGIKQIYEGTLAGYEVTYTQKEGNYFESRTFFPKKGITSFNRLFISGGDVSVIGFHLNEMMSGYPDEITLKSLLPPFGTRLWYYGLAEYAHSAALTDFRIVNEGMVFVFEGEFADGSGIPGDFTVEYMYDRENGTVTESVTKNTRSEINQINSILHDFIILKTPLIAGNNWTQDVWIDQSGYKLYAVITSVYIDADDHTRINYAVRYTIKGIPGYFDDTYIQERIFKTGFGMISFSQLMEGDIGLSGKELEDDLLVRQALINHMFGYGSSFNN